MPKFNLYQSLHTTVVGPQGKPVEVQIRTEEMHRRAEYGVAAHWGYKEQHNPTDDLVWLQPHRRLAAGDAATPTSSWQNLKIDLEQDEVFVFTPKGKVVTLPTGATPIDFAYAIHTEVGHRCIGARVNGRLVPLDSELQSGDTVEIFTSKVEGAGPVARLAASSSPTPRAAHKIRQWFSRERREDAIETGREELVKALRREGLPVQKLVGSDMLDERRRRAELRRPRRALRRDRREPRLGQGGRRSASHASCARATSEREEQLPITVPHAARPSKRTRQRRRPRRGPRRRHGAPVAVLHAGARRRDHGLRHPRPRRVGAPRRLRQRGVAVDGPDRPAHRGRVGRRRRTARSSPSIEVEGARPVDACCATSPTCCREHHVNILACIDADRSRPRRRDALRVRARRPAATSTRCSARSAASTASTTPTGSCPARAAERANRAVRVPHPSGNIVVWTLT